MIEVTKNGDSFIGYEYKSITVKQAMESVYADSYPSFGWELEGTATPFAGVSSVTMKFKRDRKIRNKVELTRLQRQFDAIAGEIVSLENSKVVGASTVAYIIGVLGTAFMAGSVFSYLAGMIALCIILAIPAFIGWIIPYFCFVRICKKKSEKVDPLIDQKYDALYEVCEKASSLVNI